MMAAVSLNRYRFRNVWHVCAPPSVVYDVLSDIANYPLWWPEVRSATKIDEESGVLRCRSYLPFDLVVQVRHSIANQQAGLLRAQLTGDLEGFASWEIIGKDGGTDWFRNLVKTPSARLRQGEYVFRVRAEEVTDPRRVEEIHRLFLDKYRSARVLSWFGSSVEQSVLIHQAETNRIRQRGDARRFEIVSEALDTRSVSPAELSAALAGHPVNIPGHVALVAHALTADSIEQLEPALTAVTRRAGHVRSVLVRPGGRDVWAWLALGELPAASAAMPPSISATGNARERRRAALADGAPATVGAASATTAPASTVQAPSATWSRTISSVKPGLPAPRS